MNTKTKNEMNYVNEWTFWNSTQNNLITHKLCNICELRFTPHTKFDRFCADCKKLSDVYKFSEWVNS